MSESVRSFIAFDIEEEAVLKQLAEMQSRLAMIGADLKLVQPQNIHITLRFLGNISLQFLEKIHEAMKASSFASFEIMIKGIGVFPNTHAPRVVWAGITEGTKQLQSIFNQLEPRLRSIGFAPDSRGFSPHLTIARVRSGRNKNELGRVIHNNSDFQFGSIKAKCLKLKKSTLTPKGPIYSTIVEVCQEQ